MDILYLCINNQCVYDRGILNIKYNSVDQIRSDTLNIDENLIEKSITKAAIKLK